MILTCGIKTFSPRDFPGSPGSGLCTLTATAEGGGSVLHWGISVSCAVWPKSFKSEWLKKIEYFKLFCSDCFPFQFSLLLPLDRVCVFYLGNCPLTLTPTIWHSWSFSVMTRNLVMTFKDTFYKVFSLSYFGHWLSFYNYVHTFRYKQAIFFYFFFLNYRSSSTYDRINPSFI